MKSYLKGILAMAMVGSLAFGLASCKDNKAAVTLEEGNWDKDNYKAIVQMINENGKTSKNYDESKKPYAVFDWDNTSIMNDVEEALLVYQIEHLAFKMTPEEMDVVLKTNIPKDSFEKNLYKKDGDKPQLINIDMITADIVDDYKVLYSQYKGFKGDKDLDAVKKSDEYIDFRAKLRYLYAAIGENFSSDVSYPWVTYLFKGMTSEEVATLTEQSNDYWLKEELKPDSWTSSEKRPGQIGVVTVKFERGLRTVPEMQNLYKTLQASGIDVYICSASYIDVVREFASNEKFGYGLPKDHVYAMQLLKTEDGKIKAELNDEYFQTQGVGKPLTIKKFIAPEHANMGPIMVGGDSNGDYDMLSQFNDTKISLIINRVKGGKIGSLCEKAIETTREADARYLLQGRNNNTGEFIPSQKTILYGSEEAELKK